jgi:hypothetical protein
LDEKSITNNPSDPNLFHYHKVDKSNPDNTIVTKNKYQLWVSPNIIYENFHYIFCKCYSFHKSFVCKHAIKLADLFGYNLKGYTKPRLFVMNAKRGAKPKKKKNSNPLDDEDD